MKTLQESIIGRRGSGSGSREIPMIKAIYINKHQFNNGFKQIDFNDTSATLFCMDDDGFDFIEKVYGINANPISGIWISGIGLHNDVAFQVVLYKLNRDLEWSCIISKETQRSSGDVMGEIVLRKNNIPNNKRDFYRFFNEINIDDL